MMFYIFDRKVNGLTFNEVNKFVNGPSVNEVNTFINLPTTAGDRHLTFLQMALPRNIAIWWAMRSANPYLWKPALSAATACPASAKVGVHS